MDKWPDQRFNPSKTKVDELKRQLLKPEAGFTKAVQVADDAGGGSAPELGRGEGRVCPQFYFCTLLRIY
jgi:hypothetical protein